MSHAPFAPSSMKRWLNCPGAWGLSLRMPELPESEYSIEGTRLHDVAANWLTGTATREQDQDYLFLKPYLDHATRLMLGGTTTHQWVERTFYHPSMSDLLFGTADLVTVTREWIDVVDLKTGAGIAVSPVENEQLLTYAGMVYPTLAKARTHAAKLPKKVRLTIVQPPDAEHPVKTWETTNGRVLEHMAQVEEAIRKAIQGATELRPGEWCRFCRAKAACPALRGEVIEALGAAETPAMMPRASLAQWLDRADRLMVWMDALKEYAHQYASEMLAQGREGIPGWELKPKRATRQWDDEEAVIAIARRRKIKIWQDKLLSPAMAEKAHPSLPEELRDHIVAVSSGTNLVRSKPGSEPMKAVEVLKSEAPPMEKLMANMQLLKYRR